MSEGKKLDILKNVLGSFTRSGNEYLFKCPFCTHHKKKLSINLEKDKYKCWICARAGRNYKLIRKLGTFLQQQSWRELTGIVEISEFEKVILTGHNEAEHPPEVEQVIDLPTEFTSLCNKNISLTAQPAINYLRNRGIEKQDIQRWKIGYCPDGNYSGRIIVPSFNEEGNVNYFIARTYEKNWRKYLNPAESKDIIFNELMIDWEDDVVLTEGVFDAIKIRNSIPILGSTLREDSKLFQKIIKNDATLYMALDPDAESKEMHMIECLLRYGVEVYKVPIKPYKDVGEMSYAEFMERKKNAALIKNTDYLLLDKILSI